MIPVGNADLGLAGNDVHIMLQITLITVINQAFFCIRFSNFTAGIESVCCMYNDFHRRIDCQYVERQPQPVNDLYGPDSGNEQWHYGCVTWQRQIAWQSNQHWQKFRRKLHSFVTSYSNQSTGESQRISCWERVRNSIMMRLWWRLWRDRRDDQIFVTLFCYVTILRDSKNLAINLWIDEPIQKIFKQESINFTKKPL